MKKITLLIASLLISAAGVAQAGVVNLVNDTVAKTIKSDSDSIVSYKLSSAQTEGVMVDYTFSFTGNLQSNDFLGFWFGNSQGPNFGLKANCGGGCTNDVFVRDSGTGGVFLSGSDLTAGTQYHLMAYLHKTNGASFYNTIDMWLNPTADEMTSLTGADITSTDNVADKFAVSSFTTLGFRNANIDNGVVLTVNGVNVNAVPEPGTVTLLGIAAAGLGFARRRKKA